MKFLLRHPEFRAGMRDMGAVTPGLAAWGVMTGVAMIKSGMSLVEVLIMGVLVFAGSAQLAAIPLIAAAAPMWVILATALCVNLRFVVFSVHMRNYVMHLPLWQRLLGGYLTADMGYVFLTRRFPQPATDPAGQQAQAAYLFGNGATGWVAWVAATLLGIALGNSVPVSWGLGFAGILALLGITCSLIGNRMRALSAGIAGAAAVAAYALPLKLNILVAIAAAVAVCMMIERPARQGAPA